MAVSLLPSGVYLIVRPCLVNRPSSMATKKPAESMAGTTPTFSVVNSGAPYCGSAVLPPTDEQPAATSATAALAQAARSHFPVLLVMDTPHCLNGPPRWPSDAGRRTQGVPARTRNASGEAAP